VSADRHFFAEIVVDSVMALDDDLDIDMIGIKKVPGGSSTESFLVQGVAFKKAFSYAGFEQQPKHFKDPKVLVLNVELELKAEKENAEVRIEDPSQYQSIVDAEWNIIYDKLDKIVASGCKVVLSKLAIGDLATQYFADRDIFCAGRIPIQDLNRVCKATGAAVQTSVNDLVGDSAKDILGTCGTFDEKSVGSERFNIFEGCPTAQTATIVLRGGAEQFIAEAERSIHDSIMVVRRAVKYAAVVPGGGAIEMDLSKYLRDYSRTIYGKQQLIVNAYAKSLEIIPRQLCDNAGFDSTNVLNLLRQKHAMGGEDGKNFGVNVDIEGVVNTFDTFVWEPSIVRRNAIQSATEAACLILSVDETVRNAKSQDPQASQVGQMMGGGRGRGGGGMRGMRGRGGR
jgi:T-complex protein 1 subunit eta